MHITHSAPNFLFYQKHFKKPKTLYGITPKYILQPIEGNLFESW